MFEKPAERLVECSQYQSPITFQSMQQTKGVGFLLRLAVDLLIAIEASFSASPIMNFDIKLFVLIVAMGKVKPNEVSDNQGEIINNNNNHRQLPCTVLIN